MTQRTRAVALALLCAAIATAPSTRATAQQSSVPDTTTPQGEAAAAVALPEPEVIDIEAILRGEGDGITAEDAARAAVTTAPSIDAARAQVAAAQAGADRAFAAFVPRLELTGRYTRLSPVTPPSLFQVDPALLDQARAAAMMVSDPYARALFVAQVDADAAQASYTFPVILDQITFGAQLTVPVTDLFLQIWPAYEAADHATHAQRYQVRAQASEIAQQAREAFYAYARARGAYAVAQQATEAVLLQEELVTAMVRAGTTAQVDLMRVQAQVAGARVATLRAEAGVRISETAVRVLMHTEDGAPIAIGEDLLGPLPTVTEPRDALVATGIESRAEMLALRRVVQARTRQIDAAEGSRWPHLALAANLLIANPNQRIFPQSAVFDTTWDVSVVASWSPNDTYTGERLADEARAARAQVEADLAALEDGIRLQVTQAYESYRAAVAAIEAARAGVQAADETLRVRTEQYRAGATVITEVVLAVNDRARAQLELIGAAVEARVAYSQLQRAIGADGPYEGID